MTWFEIIILAIIQGITEFLPISSSAHLLLPAELLGWRSQGLAFDVAVHVGSLLAVLIYLRQDVARMTVAFCSHGWRAQQTDDSRLAWWVIVGTIPVVIAGFLMKDWIELNARTALVMATTTILFGLLLWYADATAKLRLKMANMRGMQALLIGLAQIVALIPGTSRSGITMTAALMLGFTREAAARFSFLLSIPAILGAGLLATVDLLQSSEAVDWSALFYGAAFSFVSAYLCIYLFLSWISRIGMLPFVIYRLMLGAVLLWFVFA
ncbi:undecaprenyl-diphosphate phosphatase [Alteromonas oceanisediminis]|uniref:undecaprenyl-diphosphate phosphatase n=1 Tax=Alteromonas oceanisediminis TaxID=2836180 RepID=UPI001BD9F00F|nr:undecaprenyl-diphosphate phosphatase [Alteromonas oceanisediminis]MBT0585300.1 undecaprenyl-diphosphate phosphatase [Alteromonas oceanisediminis]